MEQRIQEILTTYSPSLVFDTQRVQRVANGIKKIIDDEIGILSLRGWPCTIGNQSRVIGRIKNYILSKDVYNSELLHNRNTVTRLLFTDVVLQVSGVDFIQLNVDKFFS